MVGGMRRTGHLSVHGTGLRGRRALQRSAWTATGGRFSQGPPRLRCSAARRPAAARRHACAGQPTKICPKRRAAFVRICFRRENNAIAWVQRGIASRTLLAQIPSFIFHRRRACQDYFPMLTARGLEYSVVYTDRSVNHMSQRFQGVMRDISGTLKKVYNAKSVVIVPGSGTFGMEAVARQFATNKKCPSSATAGSASAGRRFSTWAAFRPRRRC